jgi:hypothetical protein
LFFYLAWGIYGAAYGAYLLYLLSSYSRSYYTVAIGESVAILLLAGGIVALIGGVVVGVLFIIAGCRRSASPTSVMIFGIVSLIIVIGLFFCFR